MKLIAFIILHLVSSIACQVINFEKYGGSRWPNHQVPYDISSDFSIRERQTILNSIDKWNNNLSNCIRFKPRNGESDYIYIISGNGCWSNTGKTGGQQKISLQRNGCLRQTIIWHQFMHSIGFAHEHNRQDRDDYVQVLWRNILPQWYSQYRKLTTDDYIPIGTYDYYSVMHFPYSSPGIRRPAFRIKQPGVDINRIGGFHNMTENDIRKIQKVYC